MFRDRIPLGQLARMAEAKRVLNDGLVPSDDIPMTLTEKLGQVVHLRASHNNHELESEGLELEKILAEQRSQRGQ